MSKRVAVMLLCLGAIACESVTEPLGPAVPDPADAKTGPRSDGAPMIDRLADSFGPFPFFCETFEGQVEGEFSSTFWFWENADGSVRGKFHDKSQNVFTNLDTGEFVVADFITNGDFTVSADGNMIEERASGPFLKVRKNGEGLVAYEIGNRKLTLDFSTFPPVIEESFNGRADFGAGPCVDLGDPPSAE